jgi:hypothetical protein
VKVLLDECVRRDVLGILREFDVWHVIDVGFASLRNGELLRQADGQFDVLVTVDKNMRYQQSLKGKEISVLVLDVPDVELSTYERFLPAIRAALAAPELGTFMFIQDPGEIDGR